MYYNMYNFELETILKLIIEIIKGCNSTEEAAEKISALLKR